MNAPVPDERPDPCPPPDPEIVLKFCELAIRAGTPGRAAAALDTVLTAPGPVPETMLTRVYRLAEKLGRAEVAARAIRELEEIETISVATARFVFQRAHASGDPALAASTRMALERRLPDARKAVFGVFAETLAAGPEAALAVARRDFAGADDPTGCRDIAQCLQAAGRSGLAVRYLRRCLRRWPSSPVLRRQMIAACMHSGMIDQGNALLDRLGAAFPDLDLGRDRLRLLTEAQQLPEALELAEDRARKGLPTLSAENFLRHQIALGRFEDAKAIVERSKSEMSRGMRSAAHFNVLHLGSLLNEIRIYSHAVDYHSRLGEPAEAIDRRLAADYYYPAQRILDAYAASRPVSAKDTAPAGRAAIPHRILQYWNTKAVPADVAGLVREWRLCDGFDHKLFNRQTAIAFLLEHFGQDHARAFRLANHVAEECDFLRLCLLWHFGGIYVDADDRRAADPRGLLALGGDLILFREPYRAICNNVICAAPKHPVMGIAVDMARQSLLNRENDGPWSKTGPGLLTRAAALFLADPDRTDAGRSVTIVPRYRLNRFVDNHVRLSYKSTIKHWDGQDRALPEPVVEAMLSLGDAAGAGSAR